MHRKHSINPMTSHKILCVAGALASAVGTAGAQSATKGATKATPGARPLNIVYIMSDDHSYQMISAYDQRYISTPNIDALAREGVRFTESFVANSISGPSRACMLTGKHSHMNGKTNNESSHQFNQSQQTLPKLLRAGGYQTAMIGKIHLDGVPQGFDHWAILPGQGDYYDPAFIVPRGMHLRNGYSLPNGTDASATDTVRYHGYVTNIITDMSLDWLEQRDKTKPFALFIHHKAAHRDWMADTVDLKAYEDRTFPTPETFDDDYAGRPAAAAQEMNILKDMDITYDLKMRTNPNPSGLGKYYLHGIYGRLEEGIKAKFDSIYDPLSRAFFEAPPTGRALAVWKYNRYMRDYAKVINSLDRNIGRVVEYLREHDLLDNTIIVYTSDQGFYMGEHGWFDKRFMYEESMRTPLVMRLPAALGYERRGDVTTLVQNIDYAPTFLDMAGLPIPSDIQGISLRRLLLKNGKEPDLGRKALYYHFYEYPGEHAVRRHYGIRTTRYKLMHFYGDIDKWEMYDLKKDPNELTNVFDDPSYAKVRRQLERDLAGLRKHYKAENAK